MDEMLEYRAEMTDTFGGEANYCWVDRTAGKKRSELAVVREVKKAFGITGLRCAREDYMDSIVLRPYGMNIIVFINFQF